MATVPESFIDPSLTAELRSIFEEMSRLSTFNVAKMTTTEEMYFSHRRSMVEQRLHALHANKPPSKFNWLDYSLEFSRLAALIYIRCALYLHGIKHGPESSILQDQKDDFVRMAAFGETTQVVGVRYRMQPLSNTWSLVVVSLLAKTAAEEIWFALRIARGAR